VLYLLIGTWVFILVSTVTLLWRFHLLDRRAEVTWSYLMRRAEVVAQKEGWVIEKKIISIPSTDPAFHSPPSGFSTLPMAAEEKSEQEGEQK
jgi:hypothetical protein